MIIFREHFNDGLNMGEAAVEFMGDYVMQANRMGEMGFHLKKIFMDQGGRVVMVFDVDDKNAKKFSDALLTNDLTMKD